MLESSMRWGNVVVKAPFQEFLEAGTTSRVYRRADVARVLRSMVTRAGIKVTSNAKVSSVAEDAAGVTVNFTDGREPARASLVVACDGANSLIRHQLLGHEKAARQPYHQTAVGFFARVPESDDSESAASLKAFSEGSEVRIYTSSDGVVMLSCPFAEGVVSCNPFFLDDSAATKAACARFGVPRIKDAPPETILSITRELFSGYMFKAYPETRAMLNGVIRRDDGGCQSSCFLTLTVWYSSPLRQAPPI